jgi:hypothetical protein
VKAFAKIFIEIPRCPLKQKYYDSFKAQMEDFGEAFVKAFHEAFIEPFPKGFPKAFAEGFAKDLPKGLVNVYVHDNGSGDVREDGKNHKTEETKDPIDSTLRGRRFSDDPQHLVDLWNEKAPQGHNRVHTVSLGFKDLIRKAYKQVPERRQWEEIIQAISLSSFLCGKKWATLDHHRPPDAATSCPLVVPGESSLRTHFGVTGADGYPPLRWR